MKYENIVEGQFIARPNRFIAQVTVNGRQVTAHVKNTGRCRELLVPGAKVYLEDFYGRMGTRKLRYSLIAVEKGRLLINMDSQAPNKVCEEGLLSGRIALPGMEHLALVQREKVYGNSRFDFYLEAEDGTKGWLEVKGVTLESDGIARFPDAPTERGVKHVEELCHAAAEGNRAYILFIVQMTDMKWMEPNDDTHKAFGDALRRASKQGVGVLAYECTVTPETLQAEKEIPVKL